MPFSVKGQLVPCGKCPTCRKRKISEWSFRLMQQEKISTTAVFLTLTYDTSRVPISPKGFMTLSKRDCQLFLKRLRKLHPKDVKLKYYLCGEYGSSRWRPHYHMILFGADKNLIQNAWKNGSIHYGSVSGASVGYSLKYISKKGKIPVHANDDRQKEFALMSKGLGLSFLSESMRQWYFAVPEERLYCPLEDGKKIGMCRYYKMKLYPDDETRRKVGAAAAARFRQGGVLPGAAGSRDKEEAVKAAFRAAEAANRKPDSF